MASLSKIITPRDTFSTARTHVYGEGEGGYTQEVDRGPWSCLPFARVLVSRVEVSREGASSISDMMLLRDGAREGATIEVDLPLSSLPSPVWDSSFLPFSILT